MAELSTIARPYAEAAFKLADGTGNLKAWSESLANLAGVAQDPAILTMIGDPKLSGAQAADVFLRVLDGKLSEHERNFVSVLAENRRLEVLPEIRAQFDVLKNEREGVQDVEIISAFPLESQQQADLIGALEQNTRKKVNAKVTIDPELIGGVKIVIGDKVIDASARAQLAALESALRA